MGTDDMAIAIIIIFAALLDTQPPPPDCLLSFPTVEELTLSPC